MPRFDFRCTQCQHLFERTISFGSKESIHCPMCNNHCEKIISPPLGIHFKGEGFYKTDSIKKDKEHTHEQPSKTPSKPKEDKKEEDKKGNKENKTTPKKEEKK